jgi:GNAT superfamily N-acetyltransferase
MAHDPRPFTPFDGWRPGVIGEVVALQARYYARHWGFGPRFEAKIASEAALFLGRYDPRVDLLTSFGAAERVVGSVTIDGSDPQRPDDLAHLRWFILDDAARGHGLGRRLIGRALEFARGTGRAGVYLWTFAGLQAARHLYDEAGFRLVEELSGDTWGTRVTEQRFELRFEEGPRLTSRR